MVDFNTALTQDKQDIKNQIGELPDVFGLPISFSEDIQIVPLFSKQFIMNPNDSFILGSPTNGVLGTNMLGDRSTEDDSFVFPYQNIVEEDLLDTTFINESVTTSTINGDGIATFTNGQILQSKTVAKIRQNISSVLVTDLNGSNLSIQVSNDGGSNYINATVGNVVKFTNSSNTDALMYKITASANTTLTGPIKIQINI